MTRPTERELSIQRLTGTSPARQRYFVALGCVYSYFGALTPPPVDKDEEAA